MLNRMLVNFPALKKNSDCVEKGVEGDVHLHCVQVTVCTMVYTTPRTKDGKMAASTTACALTQALDITPVLKG